MPKLTDALAAHLQIIDADLAVSEIPVRLRPLHAARTWVKDFVIEVSGDDKSDFESKEWFAVIYHHVVAWYRDHYGTALDRDDTNVTSGVVLVREVPVELRVPLTRSRVETPGETAWLLFPIKVEADEDPLEWLVSPPNVDKLAETERKSLLRQASTVATALRVVQLNLMGVEPADATVDGLLDGVLPELQAAARLIFLNDAKGRGSALWALQMAVERTLKAFAKHKTGSFREIHNLFELFDDVAAHAGTVKRDSLKKLPRDKQVVTDRYGLDGTPTLWECVEAYDAALSVVSGISALFDRKFDIGGGGFLLKKPPWVTLPTSAKTGAPPEDQPGLSGTRPDESKTT